MIVIDLNDAGVRASEGGALRVQSPAFVHLDRRQATIGDAAAARYKLDPARTESEFWHRFGRDELRRSHRLARYQADLAYLHLEDLWGRVGGKGPVVFVVPADFRKDQAALLLGMARRLEIPVRGIVDAGVAASSRPRPGRHLLHLDLHLYRAVLTDLEQGEALSVRRGAATPEVGWLRVHDAWADAVARVFVQATRFDPMHDAAVEQNLHDQLAGWAEALQDADQVAVSLEDRGRRFDAELNRNAIVAAATPIYRRLADFVAEAIPGGAPATLQVTARAGRLPGLVETLGEIPELEVLQLADDAVAQGIEELELPDAGSEQVPFLRSKPWWARSTQGEHDRAIDDYVRRAPTHWVVGGVARPIGAGVRLSEEGLPVDDEAAAYLELVTDEQGVRLHSSGRAGLAMNGRAVAAQPQALAAGDRLRADAVGLDILLVAVEGDGP